MGGVRLANVRGIHWRFVSRVTEHLDDDIRNFAGGDESLIRLEMEAKRYNASPPFVHQIYQAVTLAFADVLLLDTNSSLADVCCYSRNPVANPESIVFRKFIQRLAEVVFD